MGLISCTHHKGKHLHGNLAKGLWLVDYAFLTLSQCLLKFHAERCRKKEEEHVVSKYTWVDMTQSRQQQELMMWHLSSSGVMMPRRM